MPHGAHAPGAPSARASGSIFNRPLFDTPCPAGRKITAGFSFIQRISKPASIDVWFPQALRKKLDELVAQGQPLGPRHFPAEWAAVRELELLQESGNYKIYDMDTTYITRTLMDLTRNMRAGGYRVTIATVGSYSDECCRDELEILDKRLQDRLSQIIHMLYLEEQSACANAANDKALHEGAWDYRTALPHVGVTLGARDLFRPLNGHAWRTTENLFIPPAPHEASVARAAAWTEDLGVADAASGHAFARVADHPKAGEYAAARGHYRFSREDCGREVTVTYGHAVTDGAARSLSAAERRHRLAQQFFDALGRLPSERIVHDTAIGLQLPESIAENEWIYLAPSDETLQAFNGLLSDVFAPFDGLSLGGLHEREGSGCEIKGTVQHMRGYGDRLTPDSDRFYRHLAQLAR